MAGHWVGLGYDDTIMTGSGSIAKTAEDIEAVTAQLIQAIVNRVKDTHLGEPI